MFLLPEKVGNLLSFNSLKEDLEVHPATIKHWVNLLERIYYGFRLRPYFTKSSRLLKKETKWYLWDWTELKNEGVRFENLVAVHLYKYVCFVNDLGLDDLSLHFLRDREKREVDFLICSKRKPLCAIECKISDPGSSKALAYYMERLHIPHAYVLTKSAISPRKYRMGSQEVIVASATEFLRHLV